MASASPDDGRPAAAPPRTPHAGPPPPHPPGEEGVFTAAQAVLHAVDRARYRTQQVFVGLRPGITPVEVAEIRRLLTPAQVLLFCGMEGRDRRHSMNMVHWVRRRYPAPGPPELLLRACLLHDIGKGTLNLVDRVLFVLLGAAGVQERVALAEGGEFRRRQWTIRHHARLGAERLEALGSEPRLVELVARHLDADAGEDDVLRWLRAADNAC